MEEVNETNFKWKLQEGLNDPLTLFALSLYACTYSLASLFLCIFSIDLCTHFQKKYNKNSLFLQSRKQTVRYDEKHAIKY